MVGPLPPTRGGVTTYMLNVMGSFLQERFEFVGFTTSRPPKKNVAANWGYAAILRGGITRTFTGILITAWHVLTFPFVVLLKRPALVQVHASDYLVFWESICYTLLSRLMRRPTLLRIGGGFDVFYNGSSPRAQRLIRAAVRMPDGLIVQSEYWRRLFEKLGRTRNVFAIANAVGEDVLLDSPPDRPQGVICLFIAGPEALRKGSRELIAAIQLLEKRGVRAEYRLLAIPKMIAQEFEQAGIAPLVRIQGSLSREEVVREMRQAHLFLLPSHGEGFPNSMLEAMSASMAVVATRVGAVPEVLEPQGGLLINAGDAAGLADAMETLIRDPQRVTQMGLYNEALVRKRYSNAVVLPQLESAYQCLINRN